MAAAEKKKPEPVDLAVIIGEGGGKPKPAMDDDDEGMEPAAGDELPADFMTAFEEYEAAEAGSPERAQAFYRAIEACKGM